MTATSGRYTAAVPATTAEGWTIRRATPPSRLAGANGIRTGKDGRIYVAQVAGSAVSAVDPDSGEIETISGMGQGIVGPDDLVFDSAGNLFCTEITQGRVVERAPDGTVRVIHGEMPVANPITCYQDRVIAGELRMDGRIIELDRSGAGLDNVTFVGNRTFVSHITGSIHEITAPGVAKPLIDKGFQWPLGISEDPEGTLLIADGGFSHLMPRGGKPEIVGNYFVPGYPGWIRDSVATGVGEWVVTTADGVVSRWRPREQASEVLASGLDVPTGIDVGPNGTVVFAVYQTGTVLSIEGGGTTTLASGLDGPMGVAVAGDGTVFVAESGKGRVVKLVGGRTETVLDGLGDPQGLAIRGGKLYVVDVKARGLIESDLAGGARRVIAAELPVGSPTGMPIKLGGVPNFCGPMWTFTGLGIGGDGTVFVSGDAEGSVLAITPV